MTVEIGPLLHCKGCGGIRAAPCGEPWEVFPSLHCDECPLWRCEDCGEVGSFASPCSCWISFDNMCLADIKAVFAADGTFSVGGLGPGEA